MGKPTSGATSSRSSFIAKNLTQTEAYDADSALCQAQNPAAVQKGQS